MYYFLIRYKIGCYLLIFYIINLLYIYMIIEKKYNLIIHYNDIVNNKKIIN